MDKLVKDIDEMEKLADHEAKLKGIIDDIKSTKTKTSAIKYNTKVASFDKATAKKRQDIAAKQKAEGVYIASARGKRIVFDFLRKTKT